MPGQEFKSLDEYEGFIKEAIAPWSPDRRIILAATMAERWLPVYEIFSKNEGWGDPTILRYSLDQVWNRVEKHQTSTENWSRLTRQVQEITPHMDDFDANEALCACIMVHYAIECCSVKDNNVPTLMGVLSGVEAVLPDVLEDDQIPARLWRQAIVREEIQKQVNLIAKIAALPELIFARNSLEPFFTDPHNVGVIQQKTKQIPTGPTNEQAYEQYRQIILLDIKSAASGLDPRQHPEFATTLYLAAWLGRYGRRRQIISGEYGALIDQIAVKMLVVKNHARDLAEIHLPNWDNPARETIEMFYQNPYNGMDAASPESPHGYGPSLRRLWIEAKLRGLSDQQAWDSIQAWAVYQPEAWSRKGKGGKKQASAAAKVLQENLTQPLIWIGTGNPFTPWARDAGDIQWRIRMNDFPDEPMYSLVINGEEATEFHDWPAAWKRE